MRSTPVSKASPSTIPYAGARVGDLYDFVMNEYRRVGWSYNSLLIGHGVGAWWHQQEPILRRNSDKVLEAGMVLALEPHKDHWHVQDMILVRDGAPELLSDSFNTDEAFIVAGEPPCFAARPVQ